MNYGEKNHSWKGDRVGYEGLHKYIKKHLKKPERCTECNKETEKIDLANISGLYKRDLSDWEWLCRNCHMKKDGRLKRLNELNKKGEESHNWKGGKKRNKLKWNEYIKRYNQKNREKIREIHRKSYKKLIKR